MFALTLTQPWATCIAHGPKRVENRTWSPHVRTPFQLAIHAGRALCEEDYAKVRDVGWTEMGWPNIAPAVELPRGAVVAVATVVAVVSPEGRPGDVWASGPYCWVLEDVRALPRPVPCRGSRRLWALPTAVEREVRAQLQEKP